MRWLRGSLEVQTEQSHPIMGTPVDVPVPRNTRRRVGVSAESLNRHSLPDRSRNERPSTTFPLHLTIIAPSSRPPSFPMEVNQTRMITRTLQDEMAVVFGCIEPDGWTRRRTFTNRPGAESGGCRCLLSAGGGPEPAGTSGRGG